MSATFTTPYVIFHQVPCRFCQEEWAEFPQGNGRGGKCDRFCTGFEDVPDAPEVNLSEASTAGILSLLGFTPEDFSCGSCDVATFRRRLMLARNSDRSALEVEPYTLPGGHAGVRVTTRVDGIPIIERMGTRFIEVGNTDEQTMDRLNRLERLAIWAQEHGHESITWG